jgi:hypothetical protein
MHIFYRCSTLLRLWLSLQHMENRNFFTEMYTRLEDTAKYFIILYG